MSLLKQSTYLLRRCVVHSVYHLRVPETRNIKRWVSPTLHELYKRKKSLDPEPEKPRSTYLEWNYESEIFSFAKRLGEEFDRSLLKRAFIQREYANLQEIKHQERGLNVPEKVHNFGLIQEGDDIISKYIRDVYGKSYPEDIVNAVHKHLTSMNMLAHVAKHMGIGDLVLTTEFPVETVTLANTFKAVVAALNRSQDLERAQLFVKDFLFCQMIDKDVYEIWEPEKPYEYLTSLLQRKGVTDIEPRLCNESASNTILANYQVGLYSKKNLLGIGWGENIQIAKDTAALDAIQKIYESYVQK